MLVHIALLRVFMLKNQEKLLPLTITIEPRHILAMNRHYDSINQSVKRNPNYSKMIRLALDQAYSSDLNKKVD